MLIIVIAVLAFALLTAGALGLVLVAYVQSRKTQATIAAKRSADRGSSFRWQAVALPVFVLILSVAAAIFFYRLLPGVVAYHFVSRSEADREVGRGLLMIATVLPQTLLALMAVGITYLMSAIGSRFVSEGKAVGAAVSGVSALMGNMVVLPQFILFFASLDIFLYNAYRVRLPPLYVFAIAVIVIGGLVLGVILFKTVQHTRAHSSAQARKP